MRERIITSLAMLRRLITTWSIFLAIATAGILERLQVRERIIASLAMLWRLNYWLVSIFIIGTITSILGNLIYNYFTKGRFDFTSSLTLTIVAFLNSHVLLVALILIVILLLTPGSFLAYRLQQRELRERQLAHEEELLNVSKGVRRALEELNAQPISLPVPTVAPATEAIWNVPYRRNPFFTGREELLKRLHNKLSKNKTLAPIQPLVIYGLGGAGKTQIVVEYAYRYRDEYSSVLWIRAVSYDTLVADFVTVANLLNLPEKDEQDQNVTVAAVKRWLANHVGWLLILDSVEDLALAYDFLPTESNGHILLTTRAQSRGSIAQGVEIEKMGLEEGALFLLKRAKIIAHDVSLNSASASDRHTAMSIVEAVDGLPLALDQAGAYIEETACSLSVYLELYQIRGATLLQRRGGFVSEHPEPVATTWSLSFEKIERANPAASELLLLCAFLHPDAIPQEIFSEGAPDLGPVLGSAAADLFELNAAMEELQKFSLIRRNPSTKTITVHRLVLQSHVAEGSGKMDGG